MKRRLKSQGGYCILAPNVTAGSLVPKRSPDLPSKSVGQSGLRAFFGQLQDCAFIIQDELRSVGP